MVAGRVCVFEEGGGGVACCGTVGRYKLLATSLIDEVIKTFFTNKMKIFEIV